MPRGGVEGKRVGKRVGKRGSGFGRSLAIIGVNHYWCKRLVVGVVLVY